METTFFIKFYKATGEFGYLSNLFKRTIEFEGRLFETAEHAYQHGKFSNVKTREWAMKAPYPHLLAILAHGLFAWDITTDWSKIKVRRMHDVVLAKFTQHADLKSKLLETGDKVLIENSKTDSFWGVGKKGNGTNMLGKILMNVRGQLRGDP